MSKASYGLICLLTAVVLTACGSSEADFYARSTKIAAEVFATQTASAPTPTDTPTITPTPTPEPPTATPTPFPPTATPTPTPSPAAVSASQWPLILADPFDSNEHNWPTGTSETDWGLVEQHLTDGKYRWDLKAHKAVGWDRGPDIDAISDFYLTTEAQRISGPDNGRYGLVFRKVDSSNFYFFGINDDQTFTFRVLHEGKWITLVGPTATSVIRPGEVNKIALVGEGSHFAFFINGQPVAEADDPKLARGKVGLVIELYDAGDKAVFEFDNFEVRAPVADIATSTPTIPSASDWPIVLTDTFNANVNDWPMGLDDNEFVRSEWRIASGKYHWKAKAYQDFHWYVYPDVRTVSDFSLTVEAQQVNGPVGTHGVVFRVSGDDFYYFGISGGEFVFFRMYRYKWATLIDWTESAAIRTGEVNRISVIAQGSHFSFFINDEFVAEADDNKIAKGKAGVTIELYNAGDEAEFEFDNFELRAP